MVSTNHLDQDVILLDSYARPILSLSRPRKVKRRQGRFPLIFTITPIKYGSKANMTGPIHPSTTTTMVTTRTPRGRSQPRGGHRREGLDPRGVGGGRPSYSDRSVFSLPPSPNYHTARKARSPLFSSASSYAPPPFAPHPKTRTSIRRESRPTAMIAVSDSDKMEMNDNYDTSRDSTWGGRGRRRTSNYLQDADVTSPACVEQRQHHQHQHEQQRHQQQRRLRDPSEGQEPPSAGRGDGSLFHNGLRGRSESSRSSSLTKEGRRSGSSGRYISRGNSRPPTRPSHNRYPPNKKEEGRQSWGSSSRTRRDVDVPHRRRSVSCPRGVLENERGGSPKGTNERQRSKSRPRSRPRPRPPPPPPPPRQLTLDSSVLSYEVDTVMQRSYLHDEVVTHSRSSKNPSQDRGTRRRNDNSRGRGPSCDSSSSPSSGGGPHQHHHDQRQHQEQQQQQHQISLVIDANGHGQFHVKSSSSPSSSMPSHLTFQVQIDEPSKRFLIHSSMGRLDKLRELHPGMNILRTLSHWNELQKRPRRLNVGDHNDATEATVIVRGGVLGIAPEQIKNSLGRTTKVDMGVRPSHMGERFSLPEGVGEVCGGCLAVPFVFEWWQRWRWWW